MGYTSELMELIKRVEKTRPERVVKKKDGQEFPALTLDQRRDRLEKYHPDFRAGALRELKVGPSKGLSIAQEIADTFEAKSRLDPDAIDYNEVHYETDVLVIGGGGAGTAAALQA
ncbi:MAG: succinate dehydrogenase/fumarate reductase flavoprotein subunit, partial [Desulfomonilaceae bacterium]